MAQSEEGSGWWNSWVQTAKEKSFNVLSVVKNDLVEFTTTMHDDTTKAAANVKSKITHESANAATQKVKHGVSSLIGGLSKALVVGPDDNFEPVRIVGGEAVVFDRAKARLHAIQIDPATYTVDPGEDPGYQAWVRDDFDAETAKGDISELLVSNVEVRALYTQLVPISVSNIDFWRRYYYKVHLLEEDETRRSQLMRRAEVVQEQTDIGWGDEDDEDYVEARAHVTKTTRATSETTDTRPVVEIKHATTATPNTDQSTSETVCSAVDKPASPRTDVADSPDQTGQLPVRPDAIAMSVTESSSYETVSSFTTSSDVVSSSPSFSAAAATVAAEIESIASEKSEPGSSWSTVSEESVACDTEVKGHGNEVKGQGHSEVNNRTHASEPALNVVVTEVGNTTGSTTPSDGSSNTKESLDEDWEKDFDVEVTAEDIAKAQQAMRDAHARSAANSAERKDDEKGDDWEDW